ncbi:MAG: ParB/RepB/Spo0J family partition protein [Pseudobdellovibrio sp.]
MTENNNQPMELHPLCTYFPRMSEDEFNALKDNLQHNGQTHPIYTLDGMILDGGNRYRALCELGIDPVMIEYTGSNPTQFILSSNLLRRHLTQGQSAAIVSASQSWVNAQAVSHSGNTAQLDTATARAKQSGVGHRTQQLADKLIKEAPAELVKEVIDGKKSLNKAIKEISPLKIVAPKPVPVAEESQETQSSETVELNSLVDEQQDADADNHVMLKVFESDDSVSESIDEVNKLTELNKSLNVRINELIAEKEEAIKTASYWKDKFLALEAELNQRITT